MIGAMRTRLLDDPYPLSRRTMVGRRGAVATSQPLAAQAGMLVLQRGGNAIDAAIATAAALTVVEPTSNGLGSDAFALVWADGALRGLNASGAAPAALDCDTVRTLGHSRVPELGWLPVIVPGAVSAWVALHQRFGRMPLAELMEPAAQLAEHGFMQPQGHVQVMVRTIDQMLRPQAVLDAPRWRWEGGATVWIEPRTPVSTIDALRQRGHHVVIAEEPSAYGHGQIIWSDGQTLLAGSESRADGQALVW